MYIKNTLSNCLAAFMLMLLVGSCKVIRPYQAPAMPIAGDTFRIADLRDTVSMGDYSWEQLFTDTILQKYIREALDKNYDIGIALQQMEIAENYLLQSKAMYFPTLSAGPVVSYQTPSQHSFLGGIRPERLHNLSLELSAGFAWEADIWGKLRSNERANYAAYLRTSAAEKAVRSRIVSEVADTYYELVALDQQLLVLDTTIINRNRNVETSRALKESGILTEVAVQQSEAQEMNVRALAVNTRHQIRILENYLCLLMGRPATALSRHALKDQQISVAISAGVPAQLLRNRPDVLAAEYDFVNAFELTNVARTEFYPSLNISGSGGLQSLDISSLFTPQALFANILAGLTQPIFSQRRIRTQYEVSRHQQEIALLNYQQTFLTASTEVSDALSAIGAQQEIATYKDQELNAYLQAIEYSQELVNFGMANYLEVLRATDNALQAELAMINARYGYLSAYVRLYRALGGGWK